MSFCDPQSCHYHARNKNSFSRAHQLSLTFGIAGSLKHYTMKKRISAFMLIYMSLGRVLEQQIRAQFW